MSRIRLTQTRVDDFRCAEGAIQSFLWDSEAPGLAVRATPTGRKTYIFQAKLRTGQTVRVAIGDVKAWRLESVGTEKPGARAKARDLQMLVDSGLDPRQVLAEQAAEAIRRAEAETARKAAVIESQRRTELLVADAWAEYLKYQKNRMDRGGDKCWGERHLQDHEKLAHLGGAPRQIGRGVTDAGPLASLMTCRLAEISSAMLASWLQNEAGSRPARAALAFRLFRAFLRWCATDERYSGLVSLDAINARTVRDEVPTPKLKTEDCLQREQLAAWFQEVVKLRSPTISAYLQILLLTGARREELAGLKWLDVDFQWKSLSIRDKVEGERTIPLTPYVESLLADLKHRNETPPPKYRILHGRRIPNDLETWRPSEWVFVGASETGRMVEPSPAHKRALQAAGLPSLTLHGLRRSFGTLAEWMDAPVGVVAQIQGHKPSALAERHYRRRPIDLLRMWHTKIEMWILEQAGIGQPTENGKQALQVALP